MTDQEAEFYVRAAYLAFLGREVDPDGLNHWRTRLNSRSNLFETLEELLESGEYLSRRVGDARWKVRLDESPATAAVGIWDDRCEAALGELRRDFQMAGRPAARAVRRVLWRALLPLTRLAVATEARLIRQAALLEHHVAILTAWVAHVSIHLSAFQIRQQKSTETAPSASKSFHERLLKDQAALGHRLLSIEEELMAMKKSRVPPDFPSLTSTVAFEDASLNLTTGPYGRFLTIVPDLVGGAIERGQFWDEHLKPIIEQHCRGDRAAIDSGAYIGFHSVILSRYARHVYAFEPQARCFRLLNANLELNARRNVTTYNLALYDNAGHMELADLAHQQVELKFRNDSIDYSKIENAAALAFVPSDGQRMSEVVSATIDGLALGDIGFIKIDAQGCDFRILSGARETIRTSRPVITFEFEAALASLHGNTLDDFRKFFADLNYEFREIAHTGAQQWDFVAMPVV